jgi:hypothetical protein
MDCRNPVAGVHESQHRSLGDAIRGPMTMAAPWAYRRSSLVLGALPTAVPCARLHARQVLWERAVSPLISLRPNCSSPSLLPMACKRPELSAGTRQSTFGCRQAMDLSLSRSGTVAQAHGYGLTSWDEG